MSERKANPNGYVGELMIPQCADVPPDERTFRHLFLEVSLAEADEAIAATDEAKGHWRHAMQFRNYAAQRRADYPHWPGVDRLRLEIESAGGVFGVAALRAWRARRCLADGVETATVDASKLVDLAASLGKQDQGPCNLDADLRGMQERFAAQLSPDALPDYATEDLLADPLEAMLRGVNEFQKLSARLRLYYEHKIGTQSYSGEFHQAVTERFRTRNLIQKVANSVAGQVMEAGGDCSIIYEIAYLSGMNADKFSLLLPKVIATLQTTKLKRESVGTFNAKGDVVESETLSDSTIPERVNNGNSMARILNAFTNGASEKAFDQIATVMDSDKTVENKVTKIENILPLGTLSAEKIGQLLGCSKQAVMKTSYWKKNRKDELPKAVEATRQRLAEKGQRYETTNGDDY